jgi:hypothetical protein
MYQVMLFGIAGLCLLCGPAAKALHHPLSPTAMKGLAIAGKLCAAAFFNGE